MCGLFGFFSEGGAPNPVIVETIAALAARRGPDSFGYVTEHGDVRRLGKMRPGDATAAKASQFMLGHCRLATMLGNKTTDAAQPIIEGEWAVTHNGTIDSCWYTGFALRTGNDSEAIAHMLARNGGDVRAALDQAATAGSYAVAIRNTRTGAITLAARNMPLWRLADGGVVYWCSIKPGDGWEKV